MISQERSDLRERGRALAVVAETDASSILSLCLRAVLAPALLLAGCDSEKTAPSAAAAAPSFELNGDSFELPHHIAIRGTRDDPNAVPRVHELTVVSSSCKLSCDFLHDNPQGMVKSQHCPGGDVVTVRFRALGVTGGGQVEAGTYTTKDGPGTATVRIKARRGTKEFESVGDVGSIELLSLGDEVAYEAKFGTEDELKKEWRAEPIGSLTTTGKVSMKTCSGFRRAK